MRTWLRHGWWLLGVLLLVGFVTPPFGRQQATPFLNTKHPLSRGMVAWWLWHPATSSGTTIRDLASARYLGTVSGASNPGSSTSGAQRVTLRQGGFGEMRFDGTDDMVTISPHVNLAAGTAYTVLAWIRQATVATGLIYGEGNAGDTLPLLWIATGPSGELQCEHRSDAVVDMTMITSSTPLGDAQWHMLGCVRRGPASWELYVDGRLTLTASTSVGTTTTTTTTLGAIRRTTTSGYVAEQLDDIALYNRALSGAEIFAFYQDSRRGHAALLDELPNLITVITANKRLRGRIY